MRIKVYKTPTLFLDGLGKPLRLGEASFSDRGKTNPSRPTTRDFETNPALDSAPSNLIGKNRIRRIKRILSERLSRPIDPKSQAAGLGGA